MAQLKLPLLYVSALFYVAVGVYHFVNPDFFLAIMPPYLPLHLELVYLSGFFEILLGGLLCVPIARNWREGASSIFWLPPKLSCICRNTTSSPFGQAFRTKIIGPHSRADLPKTEQVGLFKAPSVSSPLSSKKSIFEIHV